MPPSTPRIPLELMDAFDLRTELVRELHDATAAGMPANVAALVESTAQLACLIGRQTQSAQDGPAFIVEDHLRAAVRLLRWGCFDQSLLVAALLKDIVTCQARITAAHLAPAGTDLTTGEQLVRALLEIVSDYDEQAREIVLALSALPGVLEEEGDRAHRIAADPSAVLVELAHVHDARRHPTIDFPRASSDRLVSMWLDLREESLGSLSAPAVEHDCAITATGTVPSDDGRAAAALTPGHGFGSLGQITAYTDGSCLVNPDGPGGWAAVFLDADGAIHHRYGSCASTTNNRMEITAAIKAIELTPQDCRLTIVSDSKYVVDGATSWMPGWKAKGWRKSSPGEISNLDLWQRLDEALTDRDVSWQWVKGHAGDEHNETADQLCGQAARDQGPDEDRPLFAEHDPSLTIDDNAHRAGLFLSE